MKHRIWKSIVPWIAALVLAACGTPPDGSGTASPGAGVGPATGTQAMSCEEAFAAAADAANLQTSPEVLDATLEACDTIDAWMQAAQANADQLEGVDAETLLIERCQAAGPEASNLCAQVREQFPERFP